MPPQPASKAKIFAFLNFLCSKLRGCGKGNKVATKTKSGNIKALLYSDSIIDLEKKYDYGLNIPTMRLGSGDCGMVMLYCKISEIALVAAYKVIEMIANMSLLSCSKNKFIHSRMCE